MDIKLLFIFLLIIIMAIVIAAGFYVSNENSKQYKINGIYSPHNIPEVGHNVILIGNNKKGKVISVFQTGYSTIATVDMDNCYAIVNICDIKKNLEIEK